MSIQHRWARVWALTVVSAINSYWVGVFYPHGPTFEVAILGGFFGFCFGWRIERMR